MTSRSVQRGNGRRGDLITPFVGRARELDLFRRALSDTCTGHGRVLLIGGDPGIGKTRLMAEACQIAEESGVKVLVGRCWEGDGAPAFWPWIQILRQYLSRQGIAPDAAITAEVSRLIAGLQTYSSNAVPGVPSADSCGVAQTRFRQFDGITAILQGAAQAGSLLIAIDDVHSADQASLQLVSLLLRATHDSKILLLATYRNEVAATNHHVRQTISELGRSMLSIHRTLRGLNDEELRELVVDLSGETPSADLVDALQRETDGNPLFVTETIRCLAQTAQSLSTWDRAHCRIEIPDSLRSIVLDRLGVVASETARLIEVSSVLGREFDLQILSRIKALVDCDLLKAIDEGIAAQLIQRIEDQDGSFRFNHSAIREVIYASIPASRRAALHLCIADALEITYQGGVVDVLPAMSFHYGKSMPVGNLEKVIGYSVAAGRRAVEMLAYEDGIEHYERAVRASDQKTIGHDQLGAILLDLSVAQNKAGKTEAARVTCARAAMIGRCIDSTDLISKAALSFGGSFPATGAADIELVNLLEEAIERHRGMPTAQHAMLLAGLSIALHLHEDLGRRAQLSRRAVEMARAVGDYRAEQFALDATHYALIHPNALPERIATARRMIDLANHAGSKELRMRGHLRLAVDLLDAGEIGGVDRELGIAACLDEELKQPLYQWQVCLLRGTRSVMSGQFDEADSFAKIGIKLGQLARDARAMSAFWAQGLSLRRDRGAMREDEADALMEFLGRYSGVTVWEAAFAYVLAHLGRISDALVVLRRLVSEERVAIGDNNFSLGTLALLAETAALVQDSHAASAVRRAMAPFAAQNVTLGLGAVFFGSVAHYVGILCATTGEFVEAKGLLGEALTANLRSGARPLVVRTRLEYGEVLRMLGHLPEARIQFEHSLAESETLGMNTCLARARAGLARLEALSASQPRGKVASVSPHSGGHAVFRSDGDFWTVSFADRTARIKGIRGFHYIAYLLARAHQPVHVLDLAVLGVRQGSGGIAGAVADQEGLRLAGLGSRGVVFDERARAEYRGRLRELSVERDEAEGLNDYGRLEQLDREIEAIQLHLSAGSAVGGRSRGWSSSGERARVSVRNAIAKALRSIGRHHEPLHRHLQNTLKTGVVCTYAPEQGVSWQITAG